MVDAYRAAGRTVIAITHDMEFAAEHFPRVVVMRQGENALDVIDRVKAKLAVLKVGAAALCGGGGQGDALIVRVPQA